MKRLFLVILLGSSVLGCAGGGPGSDRTSATCAAPYIDTRASVQPGGPAGSPPLVAGQTVTFHGHGYFADCYDTGQEGTPPPIDTVVLVVEMPDGRRTELDPVHPDRNGTFAVELAIPADSEPGTLRIFEDHGAGVVGAGTPFSVEAAPGSDHAAPGD